MENALLLADADWKLAAYLFGFFGGIWLLATVGEFVVDEIKHGRKNRESHDAAMEEAGRRYAQARAVDEEALALMERLPVEDVSTSPLFHEPIYDAARDRFELPCGGSSTFPGEESDGYRGVVTRSQAARYLQGQPYGMRAALIDGGRYLGLVTAPSSVEPGGEMWRLVRIGQDRWFAFFWHLGHRPSAGALDPLLYITSVNANPEQWRIQHENAAQVQRSSPQYQEARAKCPHRAKS